MNKKFKIIINVIIVILFVYLCTQLDYKGMWGALSQVPLYILLALVGVQLIDLGIVTYQHMRLGRTVGYRLTFFKTLYVTCMGHMFDAITPGGGVGGEAVKVLELKKQARIPYTTGTAIILSQKTVSTCALTFFCLLGFIYMVLTNAIQMVLWMKIATIALFLGILLLVFWVFYHPAHFIAKAQRIRHRKIRETIVLFLEGIVQISDNRSEVFTQVFLSLIVWAINPVRIWLLLQITQTNVNIVLVFGVGFIAYAAAMLPIFPGGMLGFELTMSGLLTMVGVPGDQSLFLATMFRAITFWFVILISLVYCGVFKLYLIFTGQAKEQREIARQEREEKKRKKELEKQERLQNKQQKNK